MTDKKTSEAEPSPQLGKPPKAPTEAELAAQKKLDGLVADPNTLDIYDPYLVEDLAAILGFNGALTISQLTAQYAIAFAYDKKADIPELKKEFVGRMVQFAEAEKLRKQSA